MPRKKVATATVIPMFVLLFAPAIPVWGQEQNSVGVRKTADQKVVDPKTSEHKTSAQKISALEQQVKELQRFDGELLERIRLLEANQKGTNPKGAGIEEASQKDATEKQPDQTKNPKQAESASSPQSTTATTGAPDASAPQLPVAEMHWLRGIQWRGFGEFDYKVLDQRTPELGTYGFVPGSAGNFYTGDFDLFLTSRLTPKTSILSEIDFEEGDAQSFKVDLRRMLFKYDVNDHLRVSLGRYQINNGYYSWAFRSASWLQTTADRPLVMEFSSDGGILPTQAIGVSITGTIPSGLLGLHYIAEYGSSDTIRPDISGDGLLNDENNGNQINLGLFLIPDRIPGLRIGGSVSREQISDLIDSAATGEFIGTQGVGANFPSPTDRWNQTIVNGHLVYIGHGVEFLNEGFLIRHAPLQPGLTFNTPAFYSQFSKKIGPLRPFFRYQYVNASDLNPIYNDVALRAGPSVGARYDVTEFWALKAQFDHTMRRGQPDLNGLHLQLSGTF